MPKHSWRQLKDLENAIGIKKRTEPQRSSGQQPPFQSSSSGNRAQPLVRRYPKVGRNDPCPCGSGIKFKKCCG
nr:SEC-C metal-binding domain-containing protein [Endozoicomonas atrinae]